MSSPDQPVTEVPPLTAFAWRNGFVRPVSGRLLSGVCGALGRGTNTDPILWRVVLAVLTLFGGIGVLIYLLGWLMLPAEGDTAAPIEALLGRGQSRTSAPLTIILGIVALISIGAFFSEPFRPGLLGAILLGGAALLLLRDQRGRARTTVAPPVPPVPGGPTVTTATPESPAPPTAPLPPTAASPPFAPHGPFVPPPPPPPPVARPLPPLPRPPKPPRSPLGGLTFSVMVLVLGVLGLVDLAGFSVPVAAYLAAALTVVGAGLIVGAWIGRARGLIALGVLTALMLGAVTGVSRLPGPDGWHGGTNTIHPTALSQLEDRYGQDVGNLRLDLRDLDFRSATTDTDITIRVGAGNATILLPPNVDAVVDAAVDVGNADVLGEHWNGLGLDKRTVTNAGDDGPGGPKLLIHASVDLGNLEVHR